MKMTEPAAAACALGALAPFWAEMLMSPQQAGPEGANPAPNSKRRRGHRQLSGRMRSFPLSSYPPQASASLPLWIARCPPHLGATRYALRGRRVLYRDVFFWFRCRWFLDVTCTSVGHFVTWERNMTHRASRIPHCARKPRYGLNVRYIQGSKVGVSFVTGLTESTTMVDWLHARVLGSREGVVCCRDSGQHIQFRSTTVYCKGKTKKNPTGR